MKILTIIQMIIAILLIVAVILQNRGTSSGIAFGGSTGSYRSKKGLEKVLFYATIVLAVFFAATSILALVTK
ncbi:MAG: preprotein translocase subunit SecG [Candidatus Levybacteria bacterium CG_4_10_14_0_2_um_filter_36_16]|nr:MAG: preprotein translocase subunit SecG [Candidatus Levybacteria bacterium CG2_30_37_29]PIR79448.1 MAG: preprotein translocase subunit SecG [Candidatus Levybacteria bacterium CG10_big_fil_rev_8_21_14_0_10_36_30]PIZ97178.1 MAG: preprotein translocase subunit SecG [Candidatus Levybacteria bacterium CG_4_10_14_0_2_um_filter_36_16]PJA90183.1 MAG: preprotein translocase subunit SecG [Candidatus Levybacteria bacterium CG_4_9_14_3_um_filter_36_7]